MPSNLRSKTQSGPVKRSCVSVAAIGSSQSGMPAEDIIARAEILVYSAKRSVCRPLHRGGWRTPASSSVLGRHTERRHEGTVTCSARALEKPRRIYLPLWRRLVLAVTCRADLRALVSTHHPCLRQRVPFDCRVQI